MNYCRDKAYLLHEELFRKLKSFIVSGISLIDIKDYIYSYFDLHEIFKISGTIPVTINLNNVVYHGIPDDTIIKSGDSLTVDVCFSYKNTLVDGAVTYLIGNCSREIEELSEVNLELIKSVTDIIKPGLKVSSLIRYVSDFVSERGYYLFPDGIGHGVGSELHIPPFISLNDFKDFGYIFSEGDIFTFEPVLLLKKEEVLENIIGEGFVSSLNRSSQFEVMIRIDDDGNVTVLNGSLLK